MRPLPILVLAFFALSPAADASIVKFDTQQNKISYEAAAGETNRVTVTQDGVTVHIVDPGAVISVQKNSICTSISSSEASCDLPSGNHTVKVVAGDLDDEVVYQAPTPGQLDGGAGNDTLTGGTAADSLIGLDGNDLLDGRGGADTYDGRLGDDRILARDGIGESVVCGRGADTGEADVDEGLDRDCEDVVKALAPPALSDGQTGDPTSAGGATGTATATDGGGVQDADDLVVADPAAMAALPDPAPGRSVSAAAGAGVILMRAPGDGRFTRLDPSIPVPVGSVVDARRGSVTILAAKNLTGAEQQATFTGGMFRVTQRKASTSMTTVLSLRGTLSCRTARAAATRKPTRVRRLWGDGHGRFTTRGRNSQATVRGTIWGVTDRCDGTLTQVKRGVVAVKDLRTGKTRVIRAGGRYLARKSRRAVTR